MGHDLPVSARRRNAAGLNPRIQRAWRGRKFLSLGSGRRASKVFGTGNSAFALYADVPGTGGNAITLAIVNGGAAPVVTVVGNAITVTTPVATTQTLDVIRALNFSVLSSPLIHAQRSPGSDATGFVQAVAATALTGGSAPG